jgi:hypothetical protein
MPALLLAATTGAAASGMVPVPVPERVRGAEHVVVATVSDLQASYQQSEFGDQLIVSHVRLQVEETLKGRPEPLMEIEVLGGTVDGITLEVSSLPRMARGERAVFFLTRDKRSARLVPHLRGQGILKLDTQNKVKGSSLDLATIRQMAASAAAR